MRPSPAQAASVVDGLVATLRSNPAMMPGAIAVVVFLVIETNEAGYRVTTWYPAALVLLLLLVATLTGLRSAVATAPFAVRAAVGLLAAFTAWSFLSITWADVDGDAWDGANRTLLYLIVYALFALLSWRAGAAATLLGAFAVGTALIGGLIFLQAATADDPERFFLQGRFAEPAGYANANAAVFLAAFWPALFLGSRREVPVLARGLLLAAAGLLVGVALTPQSRASLVATAIVLALYIAFVPGRVRSLVFLFLVALAALVPLRWTLDLYDAAQRGADLHDVLTRGAVALAVSSGFLFVVGVALAIVDRRLAVSERTVRRTGQTVAILGIAVALASVGALITMDHPVRRVEDGWHRFKTAKEAETSTHFTAGLGGARYDLWRVALNEFRRSPWHGVGVDNYAVDYLRERKTQNEPLYPHSVQLRVLAQTGLVGTALFVGFLIFALAAVWRRAASSRPFERGLATVAVVAFGYWFVHGSADWLWEFAGLGAPAVAWLGMASGIGRPLGEATEVASSRARRAASRVPAAVLVAVALVSLLLPWLAAKEVANATREWQTDSGAAFERLDRARRLNFLSDRPDLVAGAIASRIGDHRRMRLAFERVLERNPSNWYAHLELAVVDSVEGRPARALARLRAARDLDPKEPVIAFAIARVTEGKPLVPRVIDRMFEERGARQTR